MASHANGLTWKQTDNALPMPFDPSNPVTALVMRCSDFIQALDQEPLRVTGLKAERYTLKIDDESIGTFTPAQLAEGINLAELSTPMSTQAMAVETLTEKHNTVHFAPLADDSGAARRAPRAPSPTGLGRFERPGWRTR